ncbi:helix-turn-helix transcriptional regulator [Paraburkholderia sacchari]|uniref:helix-turn-helix transcriptional regulator n=1 Tax=Paraburkholderia sacchari TaxID=159450 RepID=UPI003D9809BA
MKNPERMNARAVCEMVGVGKTTLSRWVEEGRFPGPVVLGPRVRYWLRPAVEEWLRERGVKVDGGAE